ncbi:lasso peptide biosynthesis B2 protein [Acinetobacter gyllenbergii]|uniref:lasso peptide biosynthesis B2 protein n=1 Tax=Acinetobacter gyllenbergii TaxID=134534 RepID=UPI00241EEB3F|nr:lasso peptide biosynthesis B2 protein [Acinetobacter gyllenbergii]
MPYKFRNNIKATICEDDLIILDIEKDAYYLINNINADLINNFLKGVDHHDLSDILNYDWLNESENIYDQLIAKKLKGYFEQRWITHNIFCEKLNFKIYLKIMIEIFKINFKIQKLDFNTISNLKNRGSIEDFSGNYEDIIYSVVSSLNKLFVLDMSNNKCLAYSFILFKILKSYGINAVLKIGVRTKPFFSHAWVEVDKKVLSDVQMVNENLAIIMEFS